MQSSEQETAFAKINLALHVRRKLANGYHEIETIFAFIDDGDLLSVSDSNTISLTISGLFAGGLSTNENLVLDAANLLAKTYNVQRGAKIELRKRLPIASGIGGGSADAAATLRLLNRFWELDVGDERLAELSKPLGADIPACLYSKTSLGTGIGQDLRLLEADDIRGLVVLLVNPLKQISTKTIFEKWDGTDQGGLSLDDLRTQLPDSQNDLEPIAVSIEPVIADVLNEIKNTNPIAAKMSGSGATCFGVYASLADAKHAEKSVLSQMPAAWTMIGKIR